MIGSVGRRARMAELGRIARDAMGGFLAFLLLAVAMGGEASHAAPFTAIAPPAAASSAADQVVAIGFHADAPAASGVASGVRRDGTIAGRGTVPASAYALLALVFSAVVAFNLAFLRHLVRVYAAPSLGQWGREIASDRARQDSARRLY